MSLLHPQLLAFMAVAQRKTVLGSAAELGITQTGVTQRIRALENQLNTSLFIRSRKGMVLTAEGEALFLYCKRVQELEGETLASIGVEKKSIRVCLHGPSSLMRARILPQLKTISEKFPQIALSFLVTDGETGVADLKSGAVQILVTSKENVSLEMDSKTIKPEKYVMVVPKAWNKRSVEDIVRTCKIVDFAESDYLTYNYLTQHGLRNLATQERHFINNTDGLVQLVASEFGYSVLDLQFAELCRQNHAISILQAEKVLLVQQAVCWYPRPNMPSYFKSILDCIK
jgi:LysR family transcriptional regulator, chromosome initiation inhibitor